MTQRLQYAPPPISRDWLCSAMFVEYPHHRHKDGHTLIVALVEEYLHLWRLALTYSEKRIVAPGCILAVKVAHQRDSGRYFHDCVKYFNYFFDREFTWGGPSDIRGTIDTITAYRELTKQSPPEQWKDILQEFSRGRKALRLVE